MSIRVRIAPSPTGTVHLGLARTALFNWAFARGSGGSFILRVEDTDKSRNSAESQAAIMDGLAWLGLDWDEGPDVGGPCGPYLQSERLASHLEAAERLLASGHVYRDFSTADELDAWRAEQEGAKQRRAYRGRDRDLAPEISAARAAAGEEFAVRFRIDEGQSTFTDMVRGTVTIPHAEIDDWVILRRSGGPGGGPTYNFVVVCDDLAMGISHVLRGEEHLVNTPKQLLLYEALDSAPPLFGHLPLMLGSGGKKLSKRDGHTSVGDYRDLGYPPEAVVNFLALQGWALDGEREVFSVAELQAAFDPRAVSKAGAVFDQDKFMWLAGEYIRAASVAELAQRCAPFVVAAGLTTADDLASRADWWRAVVAQEQERIRLYSEIPERVAYLFADDEAVPYAPKAEKNARRHESRLDTLAAFADFIASFGGAGGAGVAGAAGADGVGGAAVAGGADLPAPAELSDATKAWMAERELPFPAFGQPVRCALTGLPGGPDLFETMVLLGSQKTLARLAAAGARLSTD
ncbi:MAG: glutamate--tRNA ligase [Planctomycetota bacterium]|jgi:glutamyl-tRNA synthetase|nr:glutamate--tRNA ligase [Planctomycetota bacterium]MDP6837967.1 glutamate--tRNA ligase [Planctomycetota bacterium]